MATYKEAGVDIEAGNKFAAMIKELVWEAWGETAAQEIGGFGGGGEIPVQKSKGYKLGIDGAGTTPFLAGILGDPKAYFKVGYDAAAMSLVDTYIATGNFPSGLVDAIIVDQLKPELYINVIKGIITACLDAGCVLVGGETAEHPGLYRYRWLFDVITAAVGFLYIKPCPVSVQEGQLIYGWPSGGVCANGFSLVRKILHWEEGIRNARKGLEICYPELNGDTLATALIRPTPMWIKAIEELRAQGVVFSGHAHITGGGMKENIPRILPPRLKAIIKEGSWEIPAIFHLLHNKGKVPLEEMRRVFNRGIIMISIVACGEVNDPNARLIGEVAERKGDEPQVEFV